MEMMQQEENQLLQQQKQQQQLQQLQEQQLQEQKQLQLQQQQQQYQQHQQMFMNEKGGDFFQQQQSFQNFFLQQQQHNQQSVPKMSLQQKGFESTLTGVGEFGGKQSSFFVIFTSKLLIQNISDKIWYYRDPQGKIQGPFSSIEMDIWNNDLYFPNDLPIAWLQTKQFISLEQFKANPLQLIKLAKMNVPNINRYLKPSVQKAQRTNDVVNANAPILLNPMENTPVSMNNLLPTFPGFDKNNNNFINQNILLNNMPPNNFTQANFLNQANNNQNFMKYPQNFSQQQNQQQQQVQQQQQIQQVQQHQQIQQQQIQQQQIQQQQVQQQQQHQEEQQKQSSQSNNCSTNIFDLNGKKNNVNQDFKGTQYPISANDLKMMLGINTAASNIINNDLKTEEEVIEEKKVIEKGNGAKIEEKSKNNLNNIKNNIAVSNNNIQPVFNNFDFPTLSESISQKPKKKEKDY